MCILLVEILGFLFPVILLLSKSRSLCDRLLEGGDHEAEGRCSI